VDGVWSCYQTTKDCNLDNPSVCAATRIGNGVIGTKTVSRLKAKIGSSEWVIQLYYSVIRETESIIPKYFARPILAVLLMYLLKFNISHKGLTTKRPYQWENMILNQVRGQPGFQTTSHWLIADCTFCKGKKTKSNSDDYSARIFAKPWLPFKHRELARIEYKSTYRIRYSQLMLPLTESCPAG
jgi:hypothetical protein